MFVTSNRITGTYTGQAGSVPMMALRWDRPRSQVKRSVRKIPFLADGLTKARSQRKQGHEAAILILLGNIAEETGDKKQAIVYLEGAGQLATNVQFYR